MEMKMLGKIVTKLAALAMTAGIVLSGAAHAEDAINLYNWSNYIPPDLLKKFEKDTGIKVHLDVYDSNETLLAKIKAGAAGYDVIVPTDYMIKIMIDEKLLTRFEAGKLANFKNVMPPLDKPSFDAKREYSAPYMWGVTGVTYDSARVPGGKLEDSWQSFFEPPAALKGRVAALNDANDMFAAASLYLGIDQCTEDPKAGQKILNVLEKQKPFLATYNSNGTIERMQAGEVIMHHQWNGSAFRTREKLKTAVFVIPREGVPFWNDNFAIPVGAKNPEGARKFIDWMMAPENIAIASNFTGYNNAIRGADQFMNAALRADPGVNPGDEMRKRFRPNQICSLKAMELRNRIWTRLMR
ncbi:extracellular solute-binding protein [Verminephrobacter eiseniae]|uniref:extracellular solute-binding protein n=2 Tax=Verminephrobacter eiseniae TaxID=364317 RepID=UPI002237C2D3|nr:extracellular solute-binding protein [Verminephrobacter eiseniae]